MAYTFPPGDVVWPARDLTALVCADGLMTPDDWRPVTFVATILGESAGDPLAVSRRAIWKPGDPAHLSVDVGLLQFNLWWQILNDPFPDVPRIAWEDALDPFKAMDHAWALLNKNRTGWHYNLTSWHAYTSGAYSKHVLAALAGMREYRTAVGLPPGVFG